MTCGELKIIKKKVDNGEKLTQTEVLKLLKACYESHDMVCDCGEYLE